MVTSMSLFLEYARKNNPDAYMALLSQCYGHVLSNSEKDAILGLSREYKLLNQ